MRRLAVCAALALALGCDEGLGSPGFTPAQPGASRLAVAVQPNNVTQLAAISPPVQIQVLNSNGQLVTNSSAAVTMSITSGTGTAGAVLSGQLIVNAINGVATFNNLRINLTGTGYRLTASSTGLTAATTATFDVVP